MPLSKEDAHLLREDDWVLVPMRVDRTNNHWDANGVTVHLRTPFADKRPWAEREASPKRPETLPSNYIHSVHHLKLKVGDWVEGPDDVKGLILFIDTERKEALVRRSLSNAVYKLDDLRRALTDEDRKRYLDED